jgi:hypothetical protein
MANGDDIGTIASVEYSLSAPGRLYEFGPGEVSN